MNPRKEATYRMLSLIAAVIFVLPCVFLVFSTFNIHLDGLWQMDSLIEFICAYKNTVILAIAGVLIQIVIALPAGYTIVRVSSFKAQMFFVLTCVFFLLLPQQALMLPQYLVLMNIGWLDSLKGLLMMTAFQPWMILLFWFAAKRIDNIQEADRPEDAAHLKGTAVLKRQCSGCNGILYGKAAFYKVFPVEVELVGTVHVQHPVHQPQALRTVQRLCQNAQPVKVVHQVVLDVLQPGFDLRHAVALDAVGQEFGLGQTVVALGKLLPQHLAVLGSHIIKAILLVRDADGLLEVCGIGGGIHERQFKVDRAVEKVEKTAPFLKNGGLILLLRQLIVDILILDGAGVVAGTDTAGAVLKHPLERDALLCRAGHRGLGRLFAILILFQKRNHWNPPSSKSNNSYWFGTDVPSGEQSAPESSTAESFRRADRSSGTWPERTWAA